MLNIIQSTAVYNLDCFWTSVFQIFPSHPITFTKLHFFIFIFKAVQNFNNNSLNVNDAKSLGYSGNLTINISVKS